MGSRALLSPLLAPCCTLRDESEQVSPGPYLSANVLFIRYEWRECTDL